MARTIIWDAASGRALVKLEGHKDRVWSVAFAPDGTRVVTGSFDNTAIIWDTASGQALTKLEGHKNGVWSVAFAPDGRQW
ncbi:MAG: hypothetical protein RML57_03890 [Acidobacteriota bacterium]|nr:hypothetical protein [Acidobacteriota bacterium]